MMFLPKLNFAVVDVRDVAAAHIKAMTTQEASGKELSIAGQLKRFWYHLLYVRKAIFKTCL